MSGPQLRMVSSQVATARTIEPAVEFGPPRPQVATSEWFARASRHAAEAVAVAEHAQRQKIERRLDKPSRGWTTIEVIRTYRADAGGERRFREEADVLTRHGYAGWLETEHVGHRLGGRLLLTAGLGVLGGGNGRRRSRRRTVTWAKAAGEPASKRSRRAALSRVIPMVAP
jgi:hypothetical protein